VFDCFHYGVLGALNKTPDRPQLQFKTPAPAPTAPKPTQPAVTAAKPATGQSSFFRTMSAQEYKSFSEALKDAPKPSPLAAAATAAAVERSYTPPVRQQVILPTPEPADPPAPAKSAPVIDNIPEEQQTLSMPQSAPWRLVGELYRSYVIVEQGDDAFLIDKHAAHERLLFDRLKAKQETISSQQLLTPVPCRIGADGCAALLENSDLLEQLGFSLEAFGDNTVLARQLPMDLAPEDAPDTLETIAQDLLRGRREDVHTVRDEVLHTVACKAAIKAGWNTDDRELKALIDQVMAREDLKYCPHGRPICISLSKKQLEKQFKRT